MPGDSNGRFQDLLGIAPDEDGFLTVSGPMAEQGIFTAGTVEGPMDVSESISHAKRAALDMKTHLRKKAKTP
jgi:heterodisulfide reductase subunit A-like polyferredoxin